MNDSTLQNTIPQRQNKGMFWKVGMIFISYYLAVFPVVILTTIFVLIFFGKGYSMTDLIKIGGSYWYIFSVIALAVGLLGIRYGVKYVARKAVIEKNDIAKIIIWFIVIQIVIQLMNISKVDLLSLAWSILILAVNGFAIKFFFKKFLQPV